MVQPVSITGPVTSILSQSPELLLGADIPPWTSEWVVSLDYITTELHNGSIPYTNIAALAYKVISFYANDANATKTAVWSSAREVFELLGWKFTQAFDAATDRDAELLLDYITTFDVLVDKFCLPPPAEAIVWIPRSPPASDTEETPPHEPVMGEFGFGLPSSCAVAKIELPAPDETNTPDLAQNLNAEALRAAGFADRTISALLPNKVTHRAQAPAADTPFNYL